MESDAKYFFVGSSVLALALAALLFVVWHANRIGADTDQQYSIFFTRHSLRGLQIGGDVTMKGIRVGTVSGLQISAQEGKGVRVDAEVDRLTPISGKTRAVLERNILTGLAKVELATDEESVDLREVTVNGVERTVIPEGADTIERIKATLADIVQSLDESLYKLNEMLSDENVQAVEDTLVHVRELSEALASAQSGFPAFLDSIEMSFQEMTDSVKVSAGVLSVEASRISNAMQQISRKFSDTAQTFEDPKSLVFGPTDSVLGPGEEK